MDDNEQDVKCNVEELESLLEKYGQILHPQHYLMVAMKRYLLYGYSNTDPDLLTKKLAYATDILAQYDTVCPGLTKERGLTLFEVFRSSFQLAKLEFDHDEEGGGSLTLEDAKRPHVMEGLAYSQLCLEEAVKCLQHERPGSFEDMVRQAALRAQKEASAIYNMLKKQ